MNHRIIFFFLAGIIVCLISIFGLRIIRNADSNCQLALSGSYFEPVHIVDFESEVPCINLGLEGNTLNAKIALGFNGQLSLPENMIQQLSNKLFLHDIFYSGITGEKYNGALYSLPEVRIGRFNFFNVQTAEDKSTYLSMSSMGKVGWNFFYRLNFFLDCNLWLIAFCDSIETLSSRGYPVQSFAQCPLLLDRQFIEFEAITEDGPLRCLLDTGSTRNFFNSSVRQSASAISDRSILFQNFRIGTKDFGPIVFQSIDTPLEVDAIIGMEFLHSKKLFIDFPNRKIYLSDF